MPTLLDLPTPDELALLRETADGYAAARGEWPVWQYVARHLDDAGVATVQVLLGLSSWKNQYRFVAALPGGLTPAPDTQIRLTVAGMFHAGHPHTNDLMRAFVFALSAACKAQRSAEPMPTKAARVVLNGAELTNEVVTTAAVNVAPEQLLEVLQGEPATWGGFMTDSDGGWIWDVTQLRLHPYREVTTGEGYLAALESLVGDPPVRHSYAALPPMAIPEALDHLDLAWRLVTKKKLVDIARASLPAAMTQPAISREEFASRCSALADLLNSFTTAVKEDRSTGVLAAPSLKGLKDELGVLLGTEAGRAQDAVDVLRLIGRVRVGQQHSGADVEGEKARNKLGLATFDSDWAGAWEHLRAVALQAFTVIREEISALLPR